MKTYEQTSIFAEALPVEIQPTVPDVSDVSVTNQRIDKKTGELVLDVRAKTTTMNVPLITKEVLAKGFLRAVVEYMDNDVSAVIDELIVIYARQSVIAEINEIVAEGDRPDEKQFEAMVEQRLWQTNYIMSGRYEIDRLQCEINVINQNIEAEAETEAETEAEPKEA